MGSQLGQVRICFFLRNDFKFIKYSFHVPPLRRAPDSITKPLKSSDDPQKQNQYNENLAKNKSKAVRHIILIRHGQYDLSGKTDKARVLTELGEKIFYIIANFLALAAC